MVILLREKVGLKGQVTEVGRETLQPVRRQYSRPLARAYKRILIFPIGGPLRARARSYS